jgi:hypothetical protein
MIDAHRRHHRKVFLGITHLAIQQWSWATPPIPHMASMDPYFTPIRIQVSHVCRADPMFFRPLGEVNKKAP